MLTNSAGDMLPKQRGYGMYFRDTCYLDHLELRVQDHRCVPLLSDASAGYQAVFELTNSRLELPDGKALAKERLSIRRVVGLREQLKQTMEIRNLNQSPVELGVEVRFASQFTNMFTVRGGKPGKRGGAPA